MGKRRELLIRLLLIIAVIGCLTHTSWGQENDIVNVTHPSLAKSEFNHEEILNHAQKSLDRSISILNTVATLMGVLAALLTLIVVIGGALGFLEYRRWQEYRGQAKASADAAKAYADEAKKAAEEAKPIIDRLKKAEEEIDTFRERATHLPSLSKPFSEDQKRLLEEYGKKIEFLEACGVPLKPEDYLSRGDDFYQSNEYELALKAYDKAIELKPDYASAWDNKGFALAKLGRYEEVLKAYDKAIELKPDYATAWDNKGFALAKLGRYEEALKVIDKAIELDPDYAEAWDSRGFALAKLGRYEEALKVIDKAIGLKSDEAEIRFHKACTYSLKGDKENALKNLSKAIDLDAKCKKHAKRDEDFKNLWDDDDFKRIVSLNHEI
jgi:tetratricopeptide (TPR) repeat protein